MLLGSAGKSNGPAGHDSVTAPASWKNEPSLGTRVLQERCLWCGRRWAEWLSNPSSRSDCGQRACRV